MVKLTKERARKPLIENGPWWLGDNVDYSDRANPKMLYSLTVQEPFTGTGSKRTEYTATFTEDEMLAIATEWLSRYATGRRNARQREEKNRARAQQP